MIYHVREIDIADNLLQKGVSRSEDYLGRYKSSMVKLFGEKSWWLKALWVLNTPLKNAWNAISKPCRNTIKEKNKSNHKRKILHTQTILWFLELKKIRTKTEKYISWSNRSTTFRVQIKTALDNVMLQCEPKKPIRTIWDNLAIMKGSIKKITTGE